ncbi:MULTISPECIES: SDR family oxidoreductase [Gordonia]|uniref:SDR family oxidoreductase n=1 Tax=Gordonia TaxID=2053 RepID=UPI0003FD958C|nr:MULTISPECIES: SDR family oxidoreductase [Gordonia]KAF0968488.1 3-alpha-hydroxycholanate dehydrogenase (NADP(+)) [Gordonia sp. YY1]
MADVTQSTTIPQSSFPQTSDLTGRSALVTGASRGIGEAIATELARRGASVVITSRKPEPLAEAAERIRQAVPSATVTAFAANTGDADDRAGAVAAAVEQGGGIHILVNNTGIAPLAGPLMDADLGAYRKTFDTNVVAALGFVQEAYRAGMKDTGGSVVNISSVAGLRSTGVIAAYGTSKAALIRLTAELAWELGPNIRVNAIAPAIVRTKFASGLIAGENEARAAAAYPMKRIGEPEDVARAVAFLASDESAWITGETLAVDGGMLATGGS